MFAKSLPTTLAKFFNSEVARLAIIILLAAFGMFGKLSDTELQPLGSAAHAAISREILRTGDWLTLHWPHSEEFSDFYQFPPLFFWLQAATFKIFGTSDWSAKLVSAFFGFLTIILTYFLARIVARDDEYVGFLSALTIILTPYFFKHSRKCELETILIFFTALGFFFFLLSLKNDNPKWLLASGVAWGFALMSKGPPALAGWASVFIYYLMIKELRWRKILSGYFWGGILLTIIIPLFWVVPQIVYKGNALYEKYFVNQIIWSLEGRSKEVSGLWQRLGGYLFFFGAFWSYYLPWSVTGISGVAKIIREKLKTFYPLVIWIAVVWVGFTLAGYKDDYYLLLFWPAWAAINGFVFSIWMEKYKERLSVFLSVLAVAFVVTVLFVPIKFDKPRNPEFPKLGGLIQSVVPEGKKVIAYKMFYYDAVALLPWYASRGAVSLPDWAVHPEAKAWRLRSPQTPDEIKKISSPDEDNFILIKKTDYEELPPDIKRKISIFAEEGRFIFGNYNLKNKRNKHET